MNIRRAFPALTALLAALAPLPAAAAGGAHVIDDAEVLDSGICHLELWATRGPDSWLTHGATACTFERLPMVEFGAFAEYLSDHGEEDLIVGPAIKVALVPVERGIGVGLAASAGFSLQEGHLETASLFVPLTADVSERVRVNVNAGWAWTHGEFGHEATFGAQVEYALAQEIGLMAEAFAGTRSGSGVQAGARWSPGNDRFDVDLLVAQTWNGARERAVTIGLTMRR
jgi:hypothetical protein